MSLSSDKSKVIDEMQLAQRRLANVGVCLMELANELKEEGKDAQAAEHYKLCVVVNAMTPGFTRATGCTMILMSIETSPRVVQEVRAAWGRIAEKLARDIDRAELISLEEQLDQLRDLLCRYAVEIQARGQQQRFVQHAVDLARRSRN